ncbi:glycoside hydrolase family 32 protein [Thalassobacillus pellis]|uniref:glycoside hydrolase family 32 protein n=1 Tax=Thalassobacillus pellis TaxID=748008 RepID=UPI00195FA1C9|nr:glycoside hydrolase family 32 protein [Thalassobacillus pellis]MBM7553565.1 sucrose-6-phosphate hydrolase SacC (GH32 family) [Thalassobacillus pellis]
MNTNYLQNFRPYLHFAPAKNWMNDPNGLVFFEGEYHLFFQYNPNDSVWGPMHWGHAISTDLIKWDEMDIALYPDELGTIFSGSAVVDWNNTTGFFPDEPGLVAIFTHHLDKGRDSMPKQSQSLAYSLDKGRSWTKYCHNPVLESEKKVDFRDPKVFWHEESTKWIMVLATGQTISIYSSPNLLDWQFESEFGDGIGSHEGVWECPDLFELKVKDTNNKKWVLFVSIGDTSLIEEGSRTQYFIGDFDGSKFIPDEEKSELLDYGRDNYAGVTFSDIPEKDGRRIYIGWMSNWKYANKVPTEGWRSQMTLPRELSLRKQRSKFKLIQEPVKEIDSYFRNQDYFNYIIKSSKGPEKLNIDGASVEMKIEFETLDTHLFSININHTEEKFTSIEFDLSEKVMTVDRKNSGITNFSAAFTYKQMLKFDCLETVKLILDSSSLELFLNEGEYALTSLVFPDKICESITFFTPKGSFSMKGSYAIR